MVRTIEGRFLVEEMGWRRKKRIISKVLVERDLGEVIIPFEMGLEK